MLSLMLASATLVPTASLGTEPASKSIENTQTAETSAEITSATEATHRAAADSTYTINVRVAGTMANELLNVIDQWTDVADLTVTGTPNSADLQILSRLTNLRRLDLSQTYIPSIGGCSGLTKLATVILPSSVLTVEARAFTGCTALTSINLPNATTIEDSGFHGCESLLTIDIPKVTTICNSAFYRCFALQSIDLSKITALGSRAFYECKVLTSVDLSSLTSFDKLEPSNAFSSCSNLQTVYLGNLPYIPSSMFSGTALFSIDLPSSVERIESYAFRSCQLTSITLNEGLHSIQNDAFGYNHSLSEITLPSSLYYINISAFDGCFVRDYTSNTYSSSLTNVYCHNLVPLATEAFTNATWVKNATLHVPAASVNAYKLDDHWYKFANIVPMDGKIDQVTITNSFTLYDYAGLADKLNLTLETTEVDYSNYATGHLTINADAPLSVGSYLQHVNVSQAESTESNGQWLYYYPLCATLITENDITADNIEIRMDVRANQWQFISFPFDVNVSDIEMPENALWVIRRYSGSDRAAMTGNTWHNMTDGMTLRAGEGYILHCIPNDDDYSYNTSITMTVRSAATNNKNNIFNHSDAVTALDDYPSEFAHNRSWNLVGNPYPSHYDISALDFTAPITIWNGDKYVAMSPLDDDYTLRPFEAFFVQRPANNGELRFGKNGRTHEPGFASRSNRVQSRTAGSNRQVLNFIISGNGASDRARLVLNEEANAEYELERDASKFMSDNKAVPQIFVNDNSVHYSIDERPCGNGTFLLGASFGEAGEYTITLDSRNFSGKATIEDTETGITADITNAPFTFVTEAGSNPSRFRVHISNDASGINGIETDSEEAPTGTPYNLKGQPTDRNAQGIIIIDGKKIKN